MQKSQFVQVYESSSIRKHRLTLIEGYTNPTYFLFPIIDSYGDSVDVRNTESNLTTSLELLLYIDSEQLRHDGPLNLYDLESMVAVCAQSSA